MSDTAFVVRIPRLCNPAKLRAVYDAVVDNPGPLRVHIIIPDGRVLRLDPAYSVDGGERLCLRLLDALDPPTTAPSHQDTPDGP